MTLRGTMCFGWLLVAAVGVPLSCTDTEQRGAPGPGEPDAAPESPWHPVLTNLPGGLLSVWGTSSTDVWVAGSDTRDGRGPLVLHFDGAAWQRRVLRGRGDVWWTHGFPGGPTFFAGSDGSIVRVDGDHVIDVPTPGAKGTVFGIWGAAPNDLWAVGGDIDGGTGAFVWRLDGNRFVEAEGLPVDPEETAAFFKVWGASASDVWIVGTGGSALHFDGSMLEAKSVAADVLFTAHGTPGGRYAAVGGADLGVLLERQALGDWAGAPLPQGTRQLFGVWLTDSGGYAVGDDAVVLARGPSGWMREAAGLGTGRALHSVWVDQDGGAWAVGGDILVPPFGAGMVLHRGDPRPGSRIEMNDAGAGGAPGSGGATGGGGAAAGGAAAGGAATGGTAGAGGRMLPDAGADAPPAPADASTDGPGLDAHDGAGSGPGSDPGRVRCGAATCTLPVEQCCAEAFTGDPTGCFPAGQACPESGASVTCDEAADCSDGQVCCLHRYAQVGDLVTVECNEGECFGPTVCGNRSDCNHSSCRTYRVMPNYFTCN